MAARLESVSNQDSSPKTAAGLDLTKPFQLGEWCIDPGLGQARNGAVIEKIDPRNIRVLQILAERQGSLVSLRELQALGWDGAIVTMDSLYQSIRQLRQALHDTRAPSRYIETLPRKGYRLMVQLSASPVACPADSVSEAQDETDRAPTAASPSAALQATRVRPIVRGLGIAAAVTVVAGAAVFIARSYFDARADVSETVAAALDGDRGAPMNVQQLMSRADVAINGGRARDASQDLQRALQLQVATTGENNEIVAKILVGLARAQLWLDDESAAYRSGMKAKEIYDRLIPAVSPERVGTYTLLSEVLVAAGEFAEAERFARQSLVLAEQLYGKGHVSTFESLGQLAIVQFAQSNLSAAEDGARKSLEVVIRARGADDFRAGHWHVILGAILSDGGQLSEAEREARLGLDILTRVTNRAHPYTLSGMHVLAETLARRRSKLDEARHLATEALDGLVQSGAAQWRIARTAGVLGEVLLLQGQPAAAERHLTMAKKHLQSSVGWPQVREVRNLDARLRLFSALNGGARSIAKL